MGWLTFLTANPIRSGILSLFKITVGSGLKQGQTGKNRPESAGISETEQINTLSSAVWKGTSKYKKSKKVAEFFRFNTVKTDYIWYSFQRDFSRLAISVAVWYSTEKFKTSRGRKTVMDESKRNYYFYSNRVDDTIFPLWQVPRSKHRIVCTDLRRNGTSLHTSCHNATLCARLKMIRQWCRTYLRIIRLFL